MWREILAKMELKTSIVGSKPICEAVAYYETKQVVEQLSQPRPQRINIRKRQSRTQSYNKEVHK